MGERKMSALSEELQREIEEVAREEDRQASEVLEDAVRHYLRDRGWQRLIRTGERRARELGVTEEDVPRLIEEYRQEKRARGH